MATSTENWLALAQAAVDSGNVQAAFEMYEAALQKDPNNVEIFETYGEMMLHYGDPAAAQRMLTYAVQISPNEGHVKYLNLAQLASGQEAIGHYENACRVLLSELARSSNSSQREEIQRALATAKCAMAEMYLTDLCEEEDAEFRCETHVDDAERYSKDTIEVHQMRGSLRLSQQRPDDATASLKEAVRLSHVLPEELQPPYESKLELGKLIMQVSPDDAFRFFQELLQLDDRNPYVWFLLGESARMSEKWHDAARLLRHARLRVQAADAGEEALNEVDTSIRLLVEAIGVEEVNRIPNMDAPNPLDFLEKDIGGEDEEWEDVDEDNEFDDVE